jgi:hypothetical protein
MAVAAEHTMGWVKELDEFKPSTSDDDDDEKASIDIRAQYMDHDTYRDKSSAASSQMEEIKQEMKLLNWHKLANEAALKAALIKTKVTTIYPFLRNDSSDDDGDCFIF